MTSNQKDITRANYFADTLKRIKQRTDSKDGNWFSERQRTETNEEEHPTKSAQNLSDERNDVSPQSFSIPAFVDELKRKMRSRVQIECAESDAYLFFFWYIKKHNALQHGFAHRFMRDYTDFTSSPKAAAVDYLSDKKLMDVVEFLCMNVSDSGKKIQDYIDVCEQLLSNSRYVVAKLLPYSRVLQVKLNPVQVETIALSPWQHVIEQMLRLLYQEHVKNRFNRASYHLHKKTDNEPVSLVVRIGNMDATAVLNRLQPSSLKQDQSFGTVRLVHVPARKYDPKLLYSVMTIPMDMLSAKTIFHRTRFADAPRRKDVCRMYLDQWAAHVNSKFFAADHTSTALIDYPDDSESDTMDSTMTKSLTKSPLMSRSSAEMARRSSTVRDDNVLVDSECSDDAELLEEQKIPDSLRNVSTLDDLRACRNFSHHSSTTDKLMKREATVEGNVRAKTATVGDQRVSLDLGKIHQWSHNQLKQYSYDSDQYSFDDSVLSEQSLLDEEQLTSDNGDDPASSDFRGFDMTKVEDFEVLAMAQIEASEFTGLASNLFHNSLRRQDSQYSISVYKARGDVDRILVRRSRSHEERVSSSLKDTSYWRHKEELFAKCAASVSVVRCIPRQSSSPVTGGAGIDVVRCSRKRSVSWTTGEGNDVDVVRCVSTAALDENQVDLVRCRADDSFRKGTEVIVGSTDEVRSITNLKTLIGSSIQQRSGNIDGWIDLLERDDFNTFHWDEIIEFNLQRNPILPRHIEMAAVNLAVKDPFVVDSRRYTVVYPLIYINIFNENLTGNHTASVSDYEPDTDEVYFYELSRPSVIRQCEEAVDKNVNDHSMIFKYRLPDWLFVESCEGFRFARWNNERNMWTTEKILDCYYDAETMAISFEVLEGGIFALLKDKFLHLPKKSWRMRPGKKDNTVELTVETRSYSISFSIENDGCTVLMPCIWQPDTLTVPQTFTDSGSSRFGCSIEQLSQRIRKLIDSDMEDSDLASISSYVLDTSYAKELNTTSRSKNPSNNYITLFKALQPLHQKKMDPYLLREALASRGLNIFPDADAVNMYPGIDKDPELETLTYFQMASTCLGCEYSSTRWNAIVNNEDIITINAKESTREINAGIDNFSTVKDCLIITAGRVAIADFSPETLKGNKAIASFPTLYQMAATVYRPETMRKICRTSSDLVEGVWTVLSLLKPLRY